MANEIRLDDLVKGLELRKNPMYVCVTEELARQVSRMNAAGTLMDFCDRKTDQRGYDAAYKEFAEASYLVVQYTFLKKEMEK